jgi:hypothetical protein
VFETSDQHAPESILTMNSACLVPNLVRGGHTRLGDLDQHRVGEFSASPREIPTSSPRQRPGIWKKRHIFKRDSLVRVLPSRLTSINVFRAALLSIVLTLAGGQSAALFCGVWCHSDEGAAGACEHPTEPTLPGIITSDECTVSSNAPVFVREDARRTSAATDEGAAPVLWLAFTPPAAGAPLACAPDSRRLLELRPLILALRI